MRKMMFKLYQVLGPYFTISHCHGCQIMNGKLGIYKSRAVWEFWDFCFLFSLRFCYFCFVFLTSFASCMV